MKNSGILLLLIAVFCACEKESEKDTDLLIGRWEVEEATRNGRPTESLAELYFEFSPDGQLQTNVTGVPEEGTYEISGDKILQRDTRLDADYEIVEIAPDNLVLTTELSAGNGARYAFYFDMKKVNTESSVQPQSEPTQTQ
jgi:hypothetical protein